MGSSAYKNKREIAGHFGVSISTIEDWTRRRVIPVIKASSRKNVYRVDKCEAALSRFEVQEVGR
jgi:predicted site-specific integrase-resolvase